MMLPARTAFELSDPPCKGRARSVRLGPDADDTDRPDDVGVDYRPPFTRSALPTLLAGCGVSRFPGEVILIIRLPARPSRLKQSRCRRSAGTFDCDATGRQAREDFRANRCFYPPLFFACGRTGAQQVRRGPYPRAPLGHDLPHEGSHRIGLDDGFDGGAAIGLIGAQERARWPEGCLAGGWRQGVRRYRDHAGPAALGPGAGRGR